MKTISILASQLILGAFCVADALLFLGAAIPHA